MNVRELIEKLSEYPQYAEIVGWSDLHDDPAKVSLGYGYITTRSREWTNESGDPVVSFYVSYKDE